MPSLSWKAAAGFIFMGQRFSSRDWATGCSEIKVRIAVVAMNLKTAAIWGVPGYLASESKFLARRNKSPDRGKTTKKQTRQAWTRKTAPATPTAPPHLDFLTCPMCHR